MLCSFLCEEAFCSFRSCQDARDELYSAGYYLADHDEVHGWCDGCEEHRCGYRCERLIPKEIPGSGKTWVSFMVLQVIGVGRFCPLYYTPMYDRNGAKSPGKGIPLTRSCSS